MTTSETTRHPSQSAETIDPVGLFEKFRKLYPHPRQQVIGFVLVPAWLRHHERTEFDTLAETAVGLAFSAFNDDETALLKLKKIPPAGILTRMSQFATGQVRTTHEGWMPPGWMHEPDEVKIVAGVYSSLWRRFGTDYEALGMFLRTHLQPHFQDHYLGTLSLLIKARSPSSNQRFSTFVMQHAATLYQKAVPRHEQVKPGKTRKRTQEQKTALQEALVIRFALELFAANTQVPIHMNPTLVRKILRWTDTEERSVLGWGISRTMVSALIQRAEVEAGIGYGQIQHAP